MVGAAPAPGSAYTISTSPGGELHWDQTQVFRDSDGRIPFWIQYQGAGELSFVQQSELRLSFLAWAEVPGADLHFFEQRVDLREPVFHPGTEADSDRKTLLFYVEEDWPQDALVIASTLITFDATGRITDADIGFNADLYDFSMNDEPADVDLRSVATHEVGHLLGIGHSELEEATMFATYLGGIEPRTLSDDDRAAVEYLYPCGALCRGIVDWRPRLDRGCALGEVAPGWWALALLPLLARRRRGALRRARAPGIAGLVLGGLVLTAPGGVRRAESTLVERVPLSRMAEVSDLAVVATVREVTPIPGDTIWSRIGLDVEEYLLGDGPGDLVIEQPGGVLEEPMTDGVLGTLALGYPQFAPGERVAVFLRTHPSRGDLQVVGLAQGKLSVGLDGSLERDLSGLALASLPGRPTPGTVSIPPTLEALRSEVRSAPLAP